MRQWGGVGVLRRTINPEARFPVSPRNLTIATGIGRSPHRRYYNVRPRAQSEPAAFDCELPEKPDCPSYTAVIPYLLWGSRHNNGNDDYADDNGKPVDNVDVDAGDGCDAYDN